MENARRIDREEFPHSQIASDVKKKHGHPKTEA